MVESANNNAQLNRQETLRKLEEDLDNGYIKSTVPVNGTTFAFDCTAAGHTKWSFLVRFRPDNGLYTCFLHPANPQGVMVTDQGWA